MSKKWLPAWLCLVAMVGCDDTSEPVVGPAAELGIVRFDVRSTPTRLEIDGLDADGQRVGHLALEIGTFALEEDGRTVYGRRMDVEVIGRAVHHESEGMVPLQLPLLSADELRDVNVFITDPHVYPLLAARGIALEQEVGSPIVDEQPYAAGLNVGCEFCQQSCYYAPPCGPYSCGQWYDPVNGGTGQYICCPGNNFTERRCTTFPGSTACGTVGMGGCAVCWSTNHSGYCYAGERSAQAECGQATACGYEFN